MWPSTSWPLSSLTLNIVFGRASRISPSSSIFSSLDNGLCAPSGPEPALELLHVDRLGALVPVLLLVGDLGVLLEGAEALRVDARVVNEQVAAATVGRDEAVALLVVEPLDRSGWHPRTFLPAGPPGMGLRGLPRAALTRHFGRGSGRPAGKLPLRHGGKGSRGRPAQPAARVPRPASTASRNERTTAPTSRSASVARTCPQPGSVTSSAPGIRRASSRPAATGMRASSSPWRTSTGMRSSPSRSRTSWR